MIIYFTEVLIYSSKYEKYWEKHATRSKCIIFFNKITIFLPLVALSVSRYLYRKALIIVHWLQAVGPMFEININYYWLKIYSHWIEFRDKLIDVCRHSTKHPTHRWRTESEDIPTSCRWCGCGQCGFADLRTYWLADLRTCELWTAEWLTRHARPGQYNMIPTTNVRSSARPQNAHTHHSGKTTKKWDE